MKTPFTALPGGGVLHDPGNELLRIDGIWAFVSVDADGNEGVCAARTPQGMMPLVGAAQRRVASLRPLAQHIANQSGKEVRLIWLSARETMEVITPAAVA